MLTKLFQWLGLGVQAQNFNKKNGVRQKKKDKHPHLHRVVVPRAHHSVSRKNINHLALKVLYRLEQSGFEAYLVGGGVRDLLLGHHPKDFDVVTNATPEQVYRLFRNSRLIGRRFKLVHVFFGSYIVEVATFRAAQMDVGIPMPHSSIQHSAHGMIVRDNVYGSLEEDVWRRDFTVNALYYAISDFSIIDYVNGLQDLKDKCLRMIGDASVRYREDPVRMLRAIRFAAKLDFTIHPGTATPIAELADLLHNVAPARLFEECLKLFFTGNAVQSFLLLRQYQLLSALFPALESALQDENQGVSIHAFITHALQKTDERIAMDKPVAIPFLMATLLWPNVEVEAKKVMHQPNMRLHEAYLEAMDTVFQAEQKRVAIPKRIMQMTKDLWLMHLRLNKQNGKRSSTLFSQPGFRGAYDFLMLRLEAGDPSISVMAHWWTDYIKADETVRLEMQTKAEGELHKQKRKEKSRKFYQRKNFKQDDKIPK